MADVTKGTNFFIVPEVDRQSATKAEAQIQSLVQKAAAAVEQGNDKVLANLNAKMARKLGQADPEVKVKVSYETNSATGQIKKIERLSASALDPMIADYKKMVAIQGESALKIKQELAVLKDKHNELKQQALTISKHGKRFKQNAKAQKLVTDETKRLEGVLRRVTTLASAKGQLRAESQKLSMMSQYNVGLNKQGQMVATVNQEWTQQRALVQGLSAQVNAAGAASMGFGAKVKAAGAAMQAAFGWIAAAVAGLTAVARAVGAITGRVKDIQAIKLTFEGLGKSIEAQNAILDSSKNIALSYGVSLRKIEGAFRRLGPAILEAGGTLKDTEGAIKSIAARTTMLGLNTEQAGRYIEAFAQVMGKGKLQSEELNQQFSELDGGLRGQLKNWLAANKGISDFEGAMKRGEITSGLFLEAFEAINEEVRNKFLRSIGDTQVAIESLGQKGGLTLNQLNAQMSTLTSIGMEGLAEAFGPLGKELMKIYAAFIQVFTKIATEMPGITSLFRGLGHVLGVIVKVSVNTFLLGFGAMVKAIDLVIQGIVMLYNWLKKLPIIGQVLQGLEGVGKVLNKNFDQSIDIFSKLSDETIGARTELEKFNDEAAMLSSQFEKGEIAAEEYHAKLDQLNQKRAAQQQANLQKEIDAEKEALNNMLEERKAQLDREEQLMERKIEQIEEAKDAQLDAIDDEIAALEEVKDTMKNMYDGKIEAVKRAAEETKNALDQERSRLQEQKAAVKRHYDERIKEVKRYYSEKKAAMEADHAEEMRQMDERIAAMQASHAARMRQFDKGPEQQKLDKMKILELEKKIAQETDEMKKQEMRAEIERMQMAERRARAEAQHSQRMAAEQQKRAALERQQAEEKKQLEEEEKKRVEEMEQARQDSIQELTDALNELAGKKREDAKAEKDEVQSLKDARKASMDEIDKGLDDLKKKRTDVNDAAKAEADDLKDKFNEQKEKVEDIDYEIKQLSGSQEEFGGAVDRVTNGALDRQLKKVLAIKKVMDETGGSGGGGGGSSSGSSGGSTTSTSQQRVQRRGTAFRASGGPVTGGSTYTVNELGKEGFLSASGNLSEIKAPAWGQWKAPGSGTVIPAHIWKGIQAGQNAKATMPRNTSPGNAVARAINTINNSGGNNINNSVTIQSSNPVQAANNMMVEMTRLRRRRFG